MSDSTRQTAGKPACSGVCKGAPVAALILLLSLCFFSTRAQAASLPLGDLISRTTEEALKSGLLQAPGLLPTKKDWPLYMRGDPAWDNAPAAKMRLALRGNAPTDFPYREALSEALEGNALAMLYLARAYARWGEETAGPLAALYPPMHSADYWLKAAESRAGAAWLNAVLGDMEAGGAEGAEGSARCREAARLGEARALYLCALRQGRAEPLLRAALAGYPEASARVAFLLNSGAEGFPLQPRLAALYWWRAALGGHAGASLACSEYFFYGLHGFPKDARRACLFALLALDMAEGALKSAAQRHLESVISAAGLSREQVWEARRDLEIFLAAPKEERRARLLRLRAEAAAPNSPRLELTALRQALVPAPAPDGRAPEGLLQAPGGPADLTAALPGTEAPRPPAPATGIGRASLALWPAGLVFLLLAYVLPATRFAGALLRFLAGARLCAPLFLCLAFWPASAPAQAAQPPTPAQRAEELSRRESALIQAAREAYLPPSPGLIPSDNELPVSQAWEDPDWDTPLMRDIYGNPYSYGSNLELYLPCLREAADGNPKAMLALSMFIYLWGYVLEELYPSFPPQVHDNAYWRAWAEKLTNPGWVELNLGNLCRRWPSSAQEHYLRAAELGNAEAMFHYYRLSGERKYYLYRSAALGFPRAAFLLGEELELMGGEENMELARRFTWLSALNGDAWGLLRSSIAFYNGEFPSGGFNCEQGYLYSLLSQRYNHNQARLEAPLDNACVFSRDKLSELAEEADSRQLWLEQRRDPHLRRERLRRIPLAAELRRELSPLTRLLQNQEGSAVSPGKAEGSGSPSFWEAALDGLDMPWHLGFYQEPGSAAVRSTAAPRPEGTFLYDRAFYALSLSLMALSLLLLYLAGRRKRRLRPSSAPGSRVFPVPGRWPRRAGAARPWPWR